jgi:pyruvate ferredoxin oxidoreductase gamma subunit
MKEIRVHGRGGQGGRTCARIIGRAGFLAGYQIQDFAIYGAERRGAPVVSFCRIDKKQILLRGYVDNPDYIIVLDETLFEVSDVLHGLKGPIIINTTRDKSQIRKKYDIRERIYTIDATGISLDIAGKDVPNVAMTGTFLKASQLFKFKHLEDAIKIELEKLSPKILKLNIKCAKECYKKVG